MATGTATCRYFVVRHVDPSPVIKVAMASAAVIRRCRMTAWFVMAGSTLVDPINLVVINRNYRAPGVTRMAGLTKIRGVDVAIILTSGRRAIMAS